MQRTLAPILGLETKGLSRWVKSLQKDHSIVLLSTPEEGLEPPTR